MSNVVGEIAINVTADVGPLMREIGRGTSALSGMQRVSENVSGGLKRFGAATGDLGKKLSIVSAGIAAVTAATFALVKGAASAGDAIGDAAKAAGMSTTAFQEYRFALKEAAAMTDEDFASAASRLNKTLGEARSGSLAAVKAFEAIGVSQAQLADGSFSTDQAMAAFIAKMEGMKDPALAAAVATDLFGKAGADLGAGLSGVPGQVQALVDRARELGVVMGPDAVAAAGQFDQKMNELGAQFEAVKMKLADVLLPVIVNELIPVLQEKVLPAIAAVVGKIGEWITWFGDLDPAIQEVVGVIVTAFAVGGPVLLAIGAVSSAIGALVAASGPIGLFIAAAALLSAAWATWGDDFMAAIGPAIEWVTGKFNDFLALLDTIIQTAKDVATAVSEALSLDSVSFSMDTTNGGRGAGGKSGGGAPSPKPEAGESGTFATGQNLAYGLRDGLNAGLDEVMPEIASRLQGVTDLANQTFGVQSPSRVFAEIGHYIGQGLAQGISDSQALVGQAVGVMGQTAVTAANGTVSDILGSLSTLFQGSKKFAAAQALVNAWAGASEALKLPFPKNIAAFAKVLATGMSAVKNIRSAAPGGGGNGGSSGAAASGAQGAATPAPTQTLNFTITNDPFGFGERVIRQLATQLNEAQRNGTNLMAVVR